MSILARIMRTLTGIKCKKGVLIFGTIRYLTLEKLRNHQNRIRILNQHNVSSSHQLTTADFITNSIYTGCPIINETKTTTIPSYIRTGDSYFRQKEHHINTMV